MSRTSARLLDFFLTDPNSTIRDAVKAMRIDGVTISENAAYQSAYQLKKKGLLYKSGFKRYSLTEKGKGKIPDYLEKLDKDEPSEVKEPINYLGKESKPNLEPWKNGWQKVNDKPKLEDQDHIKVLEEEVARWQNLYIKLAETIASAR